MNYTAIEEQLQALVKEQRQTNEKLTAVLKALKTLQESVVRLQQQR